MVLQGDASFGVGAKAGPLMELRSSNIGTPLVVKEVAVYSYDAIQNLREVTVLNMISNWFHSPASLAAPSGAALIS